MSERYDFVRLCATGIPTLEKLFLAGTMPRMTEMAGWEFQGWNASFTASIIHIRRFTKGFEPLPPETAEPITLDGYNVLIKQVGDPANPWTPWMRRGVPLKHGLFKVFPVRPDIADSKYPNALLFDYSLGANPWYHPGRVLRDYAVQVHEDDPTLLVGKAYVALGPSRIFGGHFILRREPRKRA